MSMFYCNGCDHLVDSDEVLFIYDWKTDYWTCANCLKADPDVDVDKILEEFDTYWTKEAPQIKQLLVVNKARKSLKRNLDKHSTGE